MGNAERTDPRINVSHIRDAASRREAVAAETARLARRDVEEVGDFMNIAQQVLTEMSALKVEVAKINAVGISTTLLDHETRLRVLEETRHQTSGQGLAVDGWRAWILVAISASALGLAAITLLSRMGVI